MKWYLRDAKLEAERAELEHQATRLIRAADRRARAATPKPASSPSPPPTGWLPLTEVMIGGEDAARPATEQLHH